MSYKEWIKEGAWDGKYADGFWRVFGEVYLLDLESSKFLSSDDEDWTPFWVFNNLVVLKHREDAAFHIMDTETYNQVRSSVQ